MNNGNAQSVSNDYGRDLGEHFGGHGATVSSHASCLALSDSRALSSWPKMVYVIGQAKVSLLENSDATHAGPALPEEDRVGHL